MKKLFYLISMVCLLASCNKDPEPEPIVVTNDALTGTWVYDNAATGVTEILKFTPNGGFYYTTVLADAAFAGYSAGNYSIADNVNVTAVGVTKLLDFTVTKLKANSFTAKDNSTGESRTYSKLVETLQLLYLESDTPGYSSLVAGNISSYKSHNEKVATVDKTGAIKAVAEGITLIDVVASEGTAVVLVKAEGLIPDYAKAIGYTKEEVLAEYGEATSAMDGAVVYISPDNGMTVMFTISKRTKKVVKVAVIYGSKKPFVNKELQTYLETKYYVYPAETTSFFLAYTDKATYDASDVLITFDNGANLVFYYINHDLFEDFSIALGKTMEEVEYMYGEELSLIDNNDSMIEYEISDELLGYAGVTLIDGVTFYFSNGAANQIDVKLSSTIKVADVTAFLSLKYVLNAEQSSDKRIIFYDIVTNMKVQFIVDENKVRYSN